MLAFKGVASGLVVLAFMARRAMADCGVGQYADDTGNCSACPPGTANPVPSGPSGGQAACVPCGGGYYNQYYGQAQCMPCPAGFYNDDSGSAQCNPCGPGTSSLGGAETCYTCGPGTYAGPGAPSCQTCPPGTYSPGHTAGCIPCTSGSFAPQGASMCYPCTAGTYSVGPVGSCSACPVGMYSNAGAASCTRCGAGTYTPAEGSPYCPPCNPGSFTDGSHACCPCCAGYQASPDGGYCEYCPGNAPYSPPGTPNGDCYNFPLPGSQIATTSCLYSAGTCPSPYAPNASIYRKRRSVFECSNGRTRCALLSGRGGFECVDTMADPDSCGGCMLPREGEPVGTECMSLPGVGLAHCAEGKCVVDSCQKGHIRSLDGTKCESTKPLTEQASRQKRQIRRRGL